MILIVVICFSLSAFMLTWEWKTVEPLAQYVALNAIGLAGRLSVVTG